jgi:hypothetical protein
VLSKAQKWASTSIGAPLLGNVEGRIFLGAFLSRGIFMRFLRDRQMPCKQVSLSIGALMGNMEGALLSGFLRERKSTSGFLSWTQRTLRFYISLGAIWNFSKEPGYPELKSDCGAQRAHL